ncbi:MAG TPA: 30S ribosomal protein S17 [Verrucomicrobia bacterium]|nr:30S ribosomal protein S17 [Verrucomicrobiota bacterium]
MDEQKSNERGVRKTMNGVVVSRSGDKTVVVQTETRIAHSVYGKIVRRKSKFHAHDEKNEAAVGDQVVIAEARPMSRMKRWRLIEVTVKNA